MENDKTRHFSLLKLLQAAETLFFLKGCKQLAFDESSDKKPSIIFQESKESISPQASLFQKQFLLQNISRK